uniref:c-type cytochrome biogenesis protein CcsB n=2 Tax=Pseudoclavibacter endophyticus TaxID=1778590 RepID=UPI003570CCEB
MPFSTVTALSNWSNTLLYAAMAVYAAAFVFFALDLARRSARTGAGSESAVGATRRRSPVGASVGGAGGRSAEVGSAGHADELDAGAGGADGVDAADGVDDGSTQARDHVGDVSGASGAGGSGGNAPRRGVRTLGRTRAHEADGWRDTKATPSLRVAMWLTIAAFLVHLAATVLRGIAAERVPWANMFEFSMTFTLLIVVVFLAVRFWADLRFLGTFITGFVTLWLGVSTVSFYVDVVPLVPALQSAWLVIHVFVASLGTGCLALGFGLSLLQLLQQRRVARALAGKPSGLRFLQALPRAERLEDLAYRINVVGFILWTFTLIAGAIWAERAWGRYWGWDTKEVWTFIIWVVYAGYIHARATRGWRGTPSAWLSIVGFATVIFNFAIVNVFFNGLHAYSGL